MFPIKIRFMKFPFIILGCLLIIISSIQATEKTDFEPESNGRKRKVTRYTTSTKLILTANPLSSFQKPRPLSTMMAVPKPKTPLVIDLTKESSDSQKATLKIPHSIISPPKKEVAKQLLPDKSEPKQSKESLKRIPQSVSLSESPSKRARRAESEMGVRFIYGTDDHIQAYSDCIDKAEAHIIIASWNVNFIPEAIFSSLLAAKRRGIYISFVVNSVKRDATLNYVYNDEEDEDDETTFNLFETKSHAKFLFVDSKSLILGSFNALGESYEETDDASFMLQGSIKQLWPFYMSIYETYTSIGEDLGGIFDGIAMISKVRNPGERPLLQRHFDDGSQIFLLRTIKEHEDFFRLATPHNGRVTIYSPFSTKDNTFKRLKTLESILPIGTDVNLRVLEKYKSGLTRLLSSFPNLKSHARIEVATSHQKIVIVGDQTICAGSLNWLSAAQDAKDSYSNVELSVVLQGPKAERIIKSYYSHT